MKKITFLILLVLFAWAQAEAKPYHNESCKLSFDVPEGCQIFEFNTASDSASFVIKNQKNSEINNNEYMKINFSFSNYKITRKIGEGGFGEIYLIEKERKLYALKKSKYKLKEEEIKAINKIINILSLINNEYRTSRSYREVSKKFFLYFQPKPDCQISENNNLKN